MKAGFVIIIIAGSHCTVQRALPWGKPNMTTVVCVQNHLSSFSNQCVRLRNQYERLENHYVRLENHCYENEELSREIIIINGERKTAIQDL